MLLFCNIGWMERYGGLKSGDQITGGGSYVTNKGHGHEICNFSPSNGYYYGFVRPPGSEIDISRIGAEPDAESLSGVTVIWTSTRPTGGTAVVGWYKDATVYKTYQSFKTAPVDHRRNGIDGYWIKAPSSMAKLLPVDERTLEIPRQVKGGMGQANVWYADSKTSASVVAKVLSLVAAGKANKSGHKSGQDIDRKSKIEKSAITACIKYFEKAGYTVNSVEKDNLGWDLEAMSGKTKLRIEVKGLSGSNFNVELTPNEYTAFVEHSANYRLAVVLNALGKVELYICRYSTEQNRWIVHENKNLSLQIEIKQSASIKCA
jgi:hypothetical protein